MGINALCIQFGARSVYALRQYMHYALSQYVLYAFSQLCTQYVLYALSQYVLYALSQLCTQYMLYALSQCVLYALSQYVLYALSQYVLYALSQYVLYALSQYMLYVLIYALRTQSISALRTQSVCALRTQPLRTQPVCALRTQSVVEIVSYVLIQYHALCMKFEYKGICHLKLNTMWGVPFDEANAEVSNERTPFQDTRAIFLPFVRRMAATAVALAIGRAIRYKLVSSGCDALVRNNKHGLLGFL
ncbi:hypothetical protein Tco_0718503 [Tanacetum coccineum]